MAFCEGHDKGLNEEKTLKELRPATAKRGKDEEISSSQVSAEVALSLRLQPETPN